MSKRDRKEDGDHEDETRKKERKLRKKLKKVKKERKKRSKKDVQALCPDNVTSSVMVVPVGRDISSKQNKKTPSSSSQLPSEPSNEKKPQELLCKDDFNIFQQKKARLLVSLLPASLRNIQRAINGAMQSLLLRHSDGVDGVLLSFDNIEIKNDDTKTNADGRRTNECGGYYGRILDEMPHIHYYITCDILVFNPTVGQKMTGVVNESFPTHVGILVYDFFNAMVNADSLRASGYSFDSDLNEWSNDDTNATIQIDDKLNFKVEKTHECNGMISIECSEPSIISGGVHSLR